MRRFPIVLLAALAFIAAPSHGARAGAAPEEALALLQKRGYSYIEIEPDDAPGYRASACKGGTRFAVTIDPQNNIVDVDPRGSCGGQQKGYAAAPPPETERRGGYQGRGHGSGPGYGELDIAYAPLLARLYRKGYYDIRVVDIDDDEIEVLACRKRRLFKIDIRLRSGRIDDIDRKGRCGPRRSAARDGVNIEAPFADIRAWPGGVRIRAPFVDLDIR
ncbi:MAG TPA: hypothetical protein ENH05_02075 [Rhizobiales bacterium]|nr:hypothetical protein [Hyphomicrobiales bacterium]